MRKLFTFLLLTVALISTAQDSIYTWNREIAIVSGVVRRASTGWQFVTPDHDPLGFSGTITATSSALTLDLDFDGMGLNPAEWTPSGVVCGADETYAREGHTFGASVSSTSIVINGSNQITPSQQIAYNGTSWAGASGYTASWNTSLQCLQLDRNLTDNSNFKQGIQLGGVVGLALQTNVSNLTQLFYNAVLVSNTNTQIRIAFYYNGSRVTTPDTNMKIYLTDFAKRPQSFDFTSNVTALQGNSNIWIVGTFVKIGTSAMPLQEAQQDFKAYPNPSNGTVKIVSESNEVIEVFDTSGRLVISTATKEINLSKGVYILKQGNNTTKVSLL